jgi:hypothetical protein
VRDKERALAKFKERLQMAIAVRYGKDSEQYRIIHPPARKKRKTTAPESAVVLSQQDAVAFLTLPSAKIGCAIARRSICARSR